MTVLVLTQRFDEAQLLASKLHRHQRRKGTDIAYISHLLIVAGLVIEHGGDEDQTIAALLHDAAEDCGGRPTLDRIRAQFGFGVAQIVADCTDSWAEPKPEWSVRKKQYLALLPLQSSRSHLVCLADKTHNAEAILADYRSHGDDLWMRFKGAAEGTRWYYRELSNFFASAMPGRLADRLSLASAGFAH